MKFSFIVNFRGTVYAYLLNPHTTRLLEKCSMTRLHRGLFSLESCLDTVRWLI